jgi:DNA (cytosine-5)-methyltransferase 1
MAVKGATNKPTAIDLFAGAGGATQGLTDAGFHVVAAIENDASAIASYRANHPAVHLDPRDIRLADPSVLRKTLKLRQGELALLKACPPCQGHSSLNRSGANDPRNALIDNVWLFIKEFRPKIVLLENVPRLKSDPRLTLLLKHLAAAGYLSSTSVVDAREFGVPQRRKRFILIAVHGRRNGELPTNLTEALDPKFLRYSPTLKHIFKYDQTLRARRDPLHRSPVSSPQVLARIKAIPRNGNRFDLPKRLRLRCHGDLKHGATASYGRISLDAGFAPTMTTRCTSPSCGSFLHPTKHRPITLREASLIQTFPRTYRFMGCYTEVERQIGNAVPVRMAHGLGLIALALIS